jgi:Ca2+-binding RTX toxin-like protein
MDNLLFGGGGNDWIDGGSGNNTLNGGAGVDTMIGGAGDDYFVITSGDSLVGNGGGDVIISEINGYTLPSSFVGLFLSNHVSSVTGGIGNASNNTLTGNSLANTLNGGAGVDTLLGDIGNDYYYIDNANDLVIEASGRGTDTVEFSFDSYTLTNNVERLVFGSGVVSGTGNSLNNSLAGNIANNTLSGATRSIRNEVDTLTGGAGSDLFILGNSSECFYNDGVYSVTGTTDYALITDFKTSESDRLQLKSGTYFFGANSGGYQDLFLELGTIDEMIARFQGTTFAENPFSSSSLLGGLTTTFV